MDAASLATALVGARSQATGTAIATTLLKQQNEQQQALVDMLGAALETGKQLQAAPAPGTGALVDVTY